MCLLRFSVTDDKGDLIGQRILPLSMIRSGYRFVTLRDKHSQPLLLTSLFVFIKIEDFVPDHWTGIFSILSCNARFQTGMGPSTFKSTLVKYKYF